MEATQSRELSGEKAKRIVEAMRSSVARRGISGSTFEHVAREAGISGRSRMSKQELVEALERHSQRATARARG